VGGCLIIKKEVDGEYVLGSERKTENRDNERVLKSQRSVHWMASGGEDRIVLRENLLSLRGGQARATGEETAEGDERSSWQCKRELHQPP